jgi:transposase-like protein
MEKKERQLGERIVRQTNLLADEQRRAATRTPEVKRRNYTDEDKSAALEHLQSSGQTIKSAARELGIPRGTLTDWAGRKKIGPKLAEQFGAVKDTLSARLEQIAYQIVDAMPAKIEEASLRDLGVTLANVIDRMRLLREEPTAITESINRKEMLERLIRRTMEQFPGITRQEVIDIIRDVKPEAIKFLI